MGRVCDFPRVVCFMGVQGNREVIAPLLNIRKTNKVTINTPIKPRCWILKTNEDI